MQVNPINSVCCNGIKKSAVPGFQGLLTGKMHKRQYVSGVTTDAYSEHDYITEKTYDGYLFLDENDSEKNLQKIANELLPEDIYNHKGKIKKSYNFNNHKGYYYDDVTEITKHKLKILGKLPIKMAEWTDYMNNKATKKSVAFIEELFTRLDLKHLIKK